MAEEKKNAHHGFGSNPEKSFEDGKKGGTPATEVSNQSSGGTGGGSHEQNSGTAMGESMARKVPQKPDQSGSELDRPITDKERGSRSS
ncbi:hypothetical protein [Sabulibacter ruber]|uniref:hypothetical protein n=1 Tax=Sabulibacter ruber TaxID=2811901 RepID=UPI001A95C00C|nr:hypothetical protein [Sabulibacter ruber]